MKYVYVSCIAIAIYGPFHGVLLNITVAVVRVRRACVCHIMMYKKPSPIDYDAK